MEHEQGKCPHCGGCLDYMEHEPEYDDDAIAWPWRCPACGKTGKEVMSLTFVEHELTN